MTEIEFFNEIDEIKHEFQVYKDGGYSFVKFFAKEMINTPSKEKEIYIRYLLTELKINRYDKRTLVLPILEEIHATESSPEIYRIYNDHLKKIDIDGKWEKDIIVVLLKFGYKKPQKFYSQYMNKYFNGKYGRFFLIMGSLYLNVNPANAINLLSNYFCKYLSYYDQDMISYLENMIGFLFYSMLNNKLDYTQKLIRRTYHQNEEVGQQLKTIMLQYLYQNQDNKLFLKWIPILENTE